MPRRSVLISPGDQRSKLDGALASAADAVVFDLEDGVAPADKDFARETVVETLAEMGARGDRPEVVIRLNRLNTGGRDDITALSDAPTPDAYLLPKVDTPGRIQHVRGYLRDAGIAASLWCLIESPGGVLSAPNIAESNGVDALVFGGEDYATAVGAERTEAGTELLYARQRTVAAAAAAGIDAIDGITTALEDVDRVAADAATAATFGFDGKLAIHPAQLEPITTAFTPSDERVAWATRVVEAAEASDEGVIRVDDEMIDAPLIERARTILERADRA